MLGLKEVLYRSLKLATYMAQCCPQIYELILAFQLPKIV